MSEQKIVDLFMANVFGKTANTSDLNQAHDGKKGHWLETQMGVKRNRNTAPDLLGYEMKDGTSSKISFGGQLMLIIIFLIMKKFSQILKKSSKTR